MKAAELIKIFRKVIDANEAGIDQSADSWPADANAVELRATIHLQIIPQVTLGKPVRHYERGRPCSAVRPLLSRRA